MSTAETSRHSGPGLWRAVIGNPLIWLLAVIIALGVATSPVFLGQANLANLLRNAAVVGLLATGFSMVLLTGRIDLSIAAVMVFSMIAGVLLTTEIGRLAGLRWMVRGNTFAGPAPLAIALCVLVGALVGLLNGVGSVSLKIASFIFTLITMTALRGTGYLLTNGAPVYYSDGLMRWLGEAAIVGLPVGFILYGIVTLIMQYVLSSTTFGSRLLAIGGNEKAARYSGINTGVIIVAAFVISGVCSALAGVLFTARLMSVEPALAQGYELIAITIAVIGGISLSGGAGSILNVLLSAVTFSAGLNLLAIWGVATWYQNLAIGIALIVTVILARVMAGDRLP